MSDEVEEKDDFDKEFDKISGEKEGDNIEDVIEGEGQNINGDPGEGDGEIITDEEDPYAGWPVEAVEKLKQQEQEMANLNHRISSDAGRVSAFQKKVNHLEGEISAIREQSSKPQPTDGDIIDAMGDEGSWDQFKEDYPEVAAAVDGRFSELIGAQKKEVEAAIAPVLDKQAEEETEKAYGAVAEQFPTWQDAVKEQHFSEWMESQPAVVQALAESDDVYDASSLIGLYDNYRVANDLPTLKATTDHGDTVVDKETTSLAEKRALQLEAGETIPSQGARVDPNAESGNDFENAFNAFAARKESKRA